MEEKNDWQEVSKRIFGEEKVVYENEHYRLVSNHWSRSVTRHMREMDIRGIELRGWTAYKLEPKDADGVKGYIVFDGDGRPYRDFASAEEALYWADAYKYIKSFENDIVTMAEKRMEKESERMLMESKMHKHNGRIDYTITLNTTMDPFFDKELAYLVRMTPNGVTVEPYHEKKEAGE